MKQGLTFLTKLTAGGLVAVAIGLWMQWLSGDPAYPKFPPGPVIFIAIAAAVIYGARWWWTPSIAGLISLFVTAGWFARLPQDMLRLSHPDRVGHFAAGIFVGSLLLISGLLLTDVASVCATVQNFRRRDGASLDGAKIACRLFGGIFVLMGTLVIVGGVHADKYHNLMHLTWGALAVIASFLGTKLAKGYCIASGAWYVMLAVLGLVMGNPALNRLWQFGPMTLHTGDHIFHLVLGSVFLAVGLLPNRQLVHRPSQA